LDHGWALTFLTPFCDSSLHWELRAFRDTAYEYTASRKILVASD
jgi:hypothetical protein